MVTCPTCRGEKVLRGLGKPRSGPCRWVEIPCYDCKGTGEVDDVRAIWMQGGETLTAFRQARDLSVREAAQWAGVLASTWSDAEHGRIDPGPLIRAVQRKAVKLG